jgi:cobalt-zinc-cadmium efflux system outer membrane protein
MSGRTGTVGAILLGLVSLAWPPLLRAQDVVQPSLSLEEARRMAAERDWTLREARAGLRQAEGWRLQAHALPNPNLALGTAKLNLTRVAPGGSTSDTTLGASELVELGGKRSLRVRAATATVAASQGQLAATRVRQDAAVVKAYAGAAATLETARVSRESAESLEHAAAIAEARFAAGEISAAERDQTRLAAGRFAAELRSTEAAAHEARIALQTLLGETAPTGDVRLADALDGLAHLVTAADAGRGPDQDRTAIDARGDVLAAQAAARQAQAGIELQRAQRIPDLTFSAQYESDRPANANTVGFGVSLSLPLFDRNRGAIAAATAAHEQAEHEAERVRAQAVAELATARAALEAAVERRRLLRDELLPRAESVRRTVAFSWEKGLASLLELLEAERSSNEVRLAAVAAENEAIQAAVDVAAARGETLP